MLVVVVVDVDTTTAIVLGRRSELGNEHLLDLVAVDDHAGRDLVGQVEEDDEDGHDRDEDEQQNERLLVEHEAVLAPTELIKRIHHLAALEVRQQIRAFK